VARGRAHGNHGPVPHDDEGQASCTSPLPHGEEGAGAHRRLRDEEGRASAAGSDSRAFSAALGWEAGERVRRPPLLPDAAMDGVLRHRWKQQTSFDVCCKVCFRCSRCFEGMFQVFHVDVAMLQK
jgi:hypothetical protein